MAKHARLPTTSNKTTSQPAPSRRIAETGDLEVAAYLEIAQRDTGTSLQNTDNPIVQKTEAIVVLDFGSQYSQLIARRIRETSVYCEIIPHDATRDSVSHLTLKGIILSGGPSSVYDPDAPLAPPWIFDSDVPVLGICYGMQLIAHQLGGSVVRGLEREYGHAVIHKDGMSDGLLDGLADEIPVWMSHGDRIEKLPPGFRSVAYTKNSPYAALAGNQKIFGIQFHPEVAHTPQGNKIIRNFILRVCGCSGNWNAPNFVSDAIKRVRNQVGEGQVICALSGGVDSAVTAALVHRAVGDQLTCIFVNNGLLRLEEPERVQSVFQKYIGLKLLYVDATGQFLSALDGVSDPEKKRKLIGENFIRVFEKQADKLGQVDFLAQGTLYPDVVESESPSGHASAKIKTHHNVGGLPERMKLRLVEPLRYLFKDEVRLAGAELGLPSEILQRQPFPGPGLAIRVMGEIKYEKLQILRACDWIVMDEIKADGLYSNLWQSFAVLTETRTVGVMGDQRTYKYVVVIRAITSDDGMTADWARLPYETLARISNRIVNEVSEVNRVVYDITSKPPGTIEWE